MKNIFSFLAIAGLMAMPYNTLTAYNACGPAVKAYYDADPREGGQLIMYCVQESCINGVGVYSCYTPG